MEEERVRMRREMIQRAKQGRAINRKRTPPTVSKQFFLFRIYVTMMLVGAAIVLSLFDTNTANTITESLKEAIAYEMPLGTIQQWKQKAMTVFEQKTTQTQQHIQNGEQIQQQTQQDTQTQQNVQTYTDTQTQQQTQNNTPTQQTTQKSSTNTFQPDLSENSGKIP